MSLREIDVLGYGVRIAAGLVEQVGTIASALAPAHSYAVITDDNVGPGWLPAVLRSFEDAAHGSRVVTRSIGAGEERKTRETWATLTDWMLATGCGRDTTVVALGGGVVGDLAGFVAATFMRGVPVVQVPTTLLAMVDAAIGGKTGVDTPAGKNLVGAFHQPAVVIVDPRTLATLPAAHVRAAMAEVLKHGAIADREYFEAATSFAVRVHAGLLRQEPFLWESEEAAEIIARSVAIKAGVVSRDERESGQRQVLNAGHTVAHAIEVVSHYRCLHGEAVSIGLVTEALIAERIGAATAGTAHLLRQALGGAGLPTSLPSGATVDALVEAMRVDKKARAGRLSFSLLAEIGRVAGGAGGWTTFVADTDVRAALAELERGPNNGAHFLVAS